MSKRECHANDRRPPRGLTRHPTRRKAIASLVSATALGMTASPESLFASEPNTGNSQWEKTIDKALSWLAKQQTRMGNWTHATYPVAMTALAGTALICSGSTTTQGPFAKSIRNAVDYLLSKCRKNGLIGDPKRDQRYTYGHGFSMLFLSQVLGEEEDIDRRAELVEILERSVKFSIDAQTKAGGWGYVSSRDSSFDEGSTTITQVQGLRGCRNAGIVVPKKAIEDAKKYIYKCQNSDGGISYSSKSMGSSRPAITAAALAALYNAGDYESKYIPTMWAYTKKRLHNIKPSGGLGFWHYTYLYYTQVVYRQGPEVWNPYRDKLNNRLVAIQHKDGYWDGNSVGKVYSTSVNLIMMQMDNGYLPIYQR